MHVQPKIVRAHALAVTVRVVDRTEMVVGKVGTGEVFTGTVQTFDPPREFSATAENFNNGIFEVHSDELLGYRDLNIFLFTYGVPQKEVAAVEAKMRGLCEGKLS